jgi:hypothetical protein
VSARAGLVVLCVAGCVGAQDDPSQVHDMRVLGVQMSPPEIMITPPPKASCFELFGGLAASLGGADGGTDAGNPLQQILPIIGPYLFPVETTWLIEDPDGGGRDISWELRACARQDDLTCSGDAGFVILDAGTTKPGELRYVTGFGLDALPAKGDQPDGGGFLLLDVIANDIYKGLGGFRVPLVMHLKAGSEEIFAQKLMVYSCQIFPDMKANVLPELPGMKLNGVDWPQDGGLTLHSADAPFRVTPYDFTALEESYGVPSFDLHEVHLQESWKVSYYTSVGHMGPNTLGGEDFTGGTDIQVSTWLPGHDGGIAEQDVDFWFVARDGRGGESWLSRRAHYVP